MKPQIVKKLFIILIGLVALISLTIYLPKLKKEPSAYWQKIKAVSKESILTAEVSQGEKAVKLVKEGNLWKVNGKKVDQDKLNSLLSGLLTQKADLISQTNRQHESLELTEEKAIKVMLDNKLTFLSGKSALTGLYLRFADSDQVFLLPSLTTADVSIEANNWYDKTITQIVDTTITKLTFKKPKETFSLIKSGEKWKLESDGKEVNQDMVKNILFTLSLFKAQKLASEEETNQYAKVPLLGLTIESDGQSQTLEFFKGKDDYLVKRNQDNEQFIVSTYQAEIFLVSKTDIEKATN